MSTSPCSGSVLGLAGTLAISFASFGAAADSSSASNFTIGGFGSVGVVHSSEDQADFASSRFAPNGAGYTRAWSPSVDSLLAAQITADITPRLSAVLQLIAEQNYNDTYWPHVEWADIKYQFTPDFSVRAGRTVLPSFLISDSRTVAYSYTWVRPPVEVYTLVPVNTSDGVDASYTVHTGNLTHALVGSFGRTQPKMPMGGSSVANREWSIADTIEYGQLTAHISYHETHLTIDHLNQLIDAFRQFGAQGALLADKYDVHNKLVTFLGVGGMYDPGSWIVMAEWGTTNLQSVLGNNTAWYVSSGYRLKKFTPYLTYANARSNNLSDPGLTLPTLPPYLVGPATELNMALNSILSTKIAECTISAGARWDFMRNFDFKVQFDHARVGAGSSGVLTNLQPGFQLGTKFNLFTATVDFVF